MADLWKANLTDVNLRGAKKNKALVCPYDFDPRSASLTKEKDCAIRVSDKSESERGKE
jgi:uncharacterized protein YjbI with pentapeptide repeats